MARYGLVEARSHEFCTKRGAIKGLRRLNTLQLSQGFTDLFSVDMLTPLLAMQGEQCKELFTKGGSND